MRAGEVRALRLRDIHLTWDKGQVESGEVIVPRARRRREQVLIPLSKRVCASLGLWMGYFANATPDSYLFPFYQVGIGRIREPSLCTTSIWTPDGSWHKGWLETCKRARVPYRWHDLMHTFVTRLAERPDVSRADDSLPRGTQCSSAILTSVLRRSRPRFAASRIKQLSSLAKVWAKNRAKWSEHSARGKS
jgi:integrase